MAWDIDPAMQWNMDSTMDIAEAEQPTTEYMLRREAAERRCQPESEDASSSASQPTASRTMAPPRAIGLPLYILAHTPSDTCPTMLPTPTDDDAKDADDEVPSGAASAPTGGAPDAEEESSAPTWAILPPMLHDDEGASETEEASASTWPTLPPMLNDDEEFQDAVEEDADEEEEASEPTMPLMTVAEMRTLACPTGGSVMIPIETNNVNEEASINISYIFADMFRMEVARESFTGSRTKGLYVHVVRPDGRRKGRLTVCAAATKARAQRDDARTWKGRCVVRGIRRDMCISNNPLVHAFTQTLQSYWMGDP